MRRTLAVVFFVSCTALASLGQVQSPSNAAKTHSFVKPEHPATPEQIREFFLIANLDQIWKQPLNQIVQMVKRTAPPWIPEAYWQDIEKTAKASNLLEQIIPIYQRYYSQEDMDAVIMFYRSPVGQRMLAAAPLAAADSQPIAAAAFHKIDLEVAARHAVEIRAAKKKYDEDMAAKSSSTKSN
jgi:hypothetical protein